jgi:hypothetical protein
MDTTITDFSAPALIADWTGPYSWPGFEAQNQLPPIPSTCGVYLQTVEHDSGYLIYLAGHSGNARKRFRDHEANRRVGKDTNVFDIDMMKAGVRRMVWSGFSCWWTDKADPTQLQARQDSLGYPPSWGHDIPYSSLRKAVAFGEHWRMVLEASTKQCREFRIFVAEFGPDGRLRKRLEAGIMDALYAAPSPYRDIPDQGMALSRRYAEQGEEPVVVENRRAAGVVLHALPERLVI